MRPSIVLTSTFAFLASASPQLLDRAAKSPCRKAVEKGAKPKLDCSSFLHTTVTPCPATKSVTVTSTNTVTEKVTSAAGVSTATAWATVWREVTVYSTIHTPSRTAIAKRAGSTCPSSSKPTNIPNCARKQCNSKQYYTACSNMGIKPKTATLAARTVTHTKTVTKPKTITDFVAASPTATVTVTSTTTTFGGSTITMLTAPTQTCFHLADASTNQEISVNSDSLWNLNYVMVASGSGSKFSLTDEQGQYGYLFIGGKTNTDSSAYTPVFGYTITDYTFTYRGVTNLDVLQFTREFTGESQDFICEIDSGEIKCSSKVTYLVKQPVTRTQPMACQVIDPSDNKSPYWKIAFVAPGFTSSACTALTLKITSC